MSILYGLCRPDAGEIRLRGQPVRFRSAHDAIRHGLGMVHQHFMLVPTLTVAENLMLGSPRPRAPLLEDRPSGRQPASPSWRGAMASRSIRRRASTGSRSASSSGSRS